MRDIIFAYNRIMHFEGNVKHFFHFQKNSGGEHMELKGSKTEANLITAFSGETQAACKYLFFAARAKGDGYEQIGDIFEQTASNEREHAKIWFKALNGGVAGTNENLKDAATGEHFEWSQMYAEFEKTAREEGFNEIAALFQGVARIEKAHEERFLHLVKNLEDGLVFERDGETLWICRNCGHIHKGESAPQVCPVCRHPQAYFELLQQNY